MAAAVLLCEDPRVLGCALGVLDYLAHTAQSDISRS